MRRKNPTEWSQVLRQEGREIFLVRLEANKEILLRRVRGRESALGYSSYWAVMGIHAYFGERSPAILALPELVGERELVVDTGSITPDMIVKCVEQLIAA